jgi:lipopolysaccharide/colanic/teichoic acid biosynthesis glycosyltransferase
VALASISRSRRNGGLANALPTGEGKQASEQRLPGYFLWKAALDRVAAAVLLIPGLPLIGLLVVLVRMTSRGPGIYRQARVGKDRRLFMMNKIRTMGIDAEDGTGAVWTRACDPRVTRLGRLLRKLHLDELPQLFNVLRGEMSLIGPRPERPEFVGVLAENIPDYLDRLTVRPGVTGLAQINLDPDTDLESVRRKLVLDLEYIHHAGFFLDVRILLCTSLRLVGLNGRYAKYLTHMHRDVPRLSRETAGDVALGSAASESATTPASIALGPANGVADGEDSAALNRRHRVHARARANGHSLSVKAKPR